MIIRIHIECQGPNLRKFYDFNIETWTSFKISSFWELNTEFYFTLPVLEREHHVISEIISSGSTTI